MARMARMARSHDSHGSLLGPHGSQPWLAWLVPWLAWLAWLADSHIGKTQENLHNRLRGKLKKLKVQLLRSNALFLCRHEDTSSLRLFSDERSGRQIIRNFSFRQRLHLLLELL